MCETAQAQEATAARHLLRATVRAQRHHKLRNKKIQRRLERLLERFMSRSAAIEHQLNDQIAAVPPAPDDVSLIRVWLRARGELIDLQRRLFTSKPPGGVKGFARFFGDFLTLAARQLEVADLVRDFGFQYCNPQPEIAYIGNTLSPA